MLPSGDSNRRCPPEADDTNAKPKGPPELGGGGGDVLHASAFTNRIQVPDSFPRREQQDTEMLSQKFAPPVDGDDSCDADDEGVITISDSDAEESSGIYERTESELQDDLDRLCIVETEAAYAQEMLEKESLALVKADVTREFYKDYDGDELVHHVEREMSEYQHQWEAVLTEVQEESTVLQERLDTAGICLPTVFKMIEKQAAANCSTVAWRRRVHWAGLQATAEVMDIVRQAEADLECSRPVMKHQGKVVEAGASGMLARKFAAPRETKDSGWEALDSPDMGMKGGCEIQLWRGNVWKDIYKATTPKQVAQLGRQLPDAYKVDEIGDLKSACEPHLLEALAHEEKHGLTTDQAESLKQITDEDDARKTRFKPMHLHLPVRKLGGVSQVYKQKDSKIKIARSPKLDEDNRSTKRRRITPIQVGAKQVPGGGDREKPAPTVIILDDDEPSELPTNACSRENSKALQLVESRIVDKMKERNVICTACGGRLTRLEVVKHPKLLVAVCRPCRTKYKQQAFTRDERGLESQCRWCTGGQNVRSCEQCGVAICVPCWGRNFGSGERPLECIFCNKALLKPLQRHADEVEQEGIRLGYLWAPRTRRISNDMVLLLSKLETENLENALGLETY